MPSLANAADVSA